MDIKQVKKLSEKQELIFRIFNSIFAKQEIGQANAATVNQVMTIAESAADYILKVNG